MKIGYGITVQESDDPYILTAEVALDGITQAGIPGAFWVDLFPILKYVPSWFPGAGFKRKAACWREAINAMADNPFRHVQEQMVQVHFSRTSWNYFNSDPTEKWQSHAVRSGKSHWAPSWRGQSTTVQRRNDCEKCGFYSLLRYVVYMVNLGRPPDLYFAHAGPFSGGAETVSNKKTIILITNYIIRLYHPCKRSSSRWHSILKYRRKLKQKSTLSLAHIVSQIFTIVLLCHISMLS